MIHTFSFFKKYYIVHYVITNVGAGNAIDFCLKLDGKIFIPPFSLIANSSKEFIFLFERTLLVDGKKDIEFVLEYSDIYASARYKQHEHIKLFADEDENLNSHQERNDLLTVQERIQ